MSCPNRARIAGPAQGEINRERLVPKPTRLAEWREPNRRDEAQMNEPSNYLKFKGREWRSVNRPDHCTTVTFRNCEYKFRQSSAT
jgi:hypothetical protein